jgi:hypothetical protein
MNTVDDYNAWNPGLTSTIPPHLLPLITLFRPENGTVSYQQAKEAADFCGLPAETLCGLSVKRLIIHEVLIRVTADLSVPDGPSYEYLGISLRSMVGRICDRYVLPNLTDITAKFEVIKNRAATAINDRLERDIFRRDQIQAKTGIFGFLRSKSNPLNDDRALSEIDALAAWKATLPDQREPAERAYLSALIMVVGGIIGQHGRLVADRDLVVELSLRIVMNNFGSREIGRIIRSMFNEGVAKESYRFLPAQSHPIVMNTKGASASGKSTIRPQQRRLAEKMNVKWEDFALISPDYWRKYLLDYETMGEDYKYAAMMTGHELEIIDRKLDSYVEAKARQHNLPHLLLDRFRFDSFKVGDDGDYQSKLLSRFGATVFLFFIITPPAQTVERAWQRGLTTARYKSVNDLLYHNIEAFNGIPELFFSWMGIGDKTVYFEFLDNDVPLGEQARTIAYGRHGHMTILDPSALGNIDRFRQVNTKAMRPDEVLDPAWQPTHDFIRRCFYSFARIDFVNYEDATIYGRVDSGKWQYKNASHYPHSHDHQDCIIALGWNEPPMAIDLATSTVDVASEKRVTIGAWAPRHPHNSQVS